MESGLDSAIRKNVMKLRACLEFIISPSCSLQMLLFSQVLADGIESWPIIYIRYLLSD